MPHDNTPETRILVPPDGSRLAAQAPPATAAKALTGVPRLLLAGLVTILIAVLIVSHLAPAAQARNSTRTTPIDTHAPLLLIHGYSPKSVVDCAGYGWSDVEAYLSIGHTVAGHPNVLWAGPIYTIGYYTQDTTCDFNLTTGTDPASVAARNACQAYPSGGMSIGDNNDPTEHLACELAWFIYYDTVSAGTLCPDGSPPCNVDIVGNNMGGLMTRWAMASSKPNNAPFPPSLLYARDIVDFDTPNNGASAAALCGTTCPYEGQEMSAGSAFISTLNTIGPYPQGAQGTHWTLMGAAAATFPCVTGQVVTAASATHLQGGTKIWYKRPCYDHAMPGNRTLTMMTNSTDTANAQVQYCLTCGSADPSRTSDAFPHSLLAMLYSLADQPILPGPFPSPLPPPSPPAPMNAALQAVAAIAAIDVWAVGSGVSSPTGVQQPLIEHWNGSRWNVVSSPHAGSGSDTAALAGVAAVSATDMWAVGNVYNSGANTIQTLAEHWNGSQWSIVPSPNATGAISSQLQSVAAVSASDVWAVGYWVDTSNFAHTLAEHWNGSQWSIVSTPEGSSQSKNYLDGVTAVSGSDVWAVGYYSNIQGYVSYALVEQWNGSQWAVVPSADTANVPNDFLDGVAAVGASTIWTVGFTGNGIEESSSQTLTEQWNGSQWSVVSSPNTTNAYNSLVSVAAVSTSDVWAVGSDTTSANVTYALTEQWNGSQWSIVPSPSVGSGRTSALAGVAAVSAGDVWAVGNVYNVASHTSQTLVEHWNGTQWRIVPSP